MGKGRCKNIISIILVMVFMSSFVPCFSVNAYAEGTDIQYDTYLDYGDFTYMIKTNNDIIIADYNGNSDTVVVPSEIDGIRVVDINPSAFVVKKDIIKSITLPDDFDIESTQDILCYLNNLQEIRVNDTNKYYCVQDGILYSKDKKVLYKYPNGKEGDSFIIPDTVSIVRESFVRVKLNKLYIPSTVNDYFSVNENIKYIRNFRIEDFCAVSDDYKINRPVNISCKINNIGTNNVIAKFVVEDEEGNKNVLPEAWLDGDNLASIEWIPQKTGKYKISVKAYDILGETEEYITKDIEIFDDKFEYSFSVSPKEKVTLGDSLNLNASVSEDAEYCFLAEKNDEFEKIRDYSKDKSFVWTPKEYGIYNLYVDVKLNNGSVIRRELFNGYEVCSKDSNKLGQIKNAIYRCMLNNTTFYMDDYLKSNEFDDFINENNLCIEDIDSINGIRDEIFVKTYQIVYSIIPKIIANKCLYNISPIGVSFKYSRNDENSIFISDNSSFGNNLEMINDIIKDFKGEFIKDNYTDVEKEAAAVKYILNNCEYDYDALFGGNSSKYMYAYSQIGVFLKNKAVCQGYAEACEHLLNSIGIECHTVVSMKLNHAWNIVKIDGKYYELDVTWLDSAYDNKWFNFSNKDEMHDYDDIDNMELYKKCTNDFNDTNVKEYSVLLNKIVGRANDNFYTQDVYGNNFEMIPLDQDRILNYCIDNENIYYLINNYQSFSLEKYNILSGENIKIKDVREYSDFHINGNCIYIFGEDPIKVKEEKTYDKKYTVSFKNGDELEEIQRVKEGETPSTPKAIPFKQGYTFIGWEENIKDTVISDKTINALFTPNTYTVTFKDYDGVELASKTVTAGSNIKVVDADLNRPGYIFAGFKIAGQEDNNIYKDTINNVVDNMVLEAVYNKDNNNPDDIHGSSTPDNNDKNNTPDNIPGSSTPNNESTGSNSDNNNTNNGHIDNTENKNESSDIPEVNEGNNCDNNGKAEPSGENANVLIFTLSAFIFGIISIKQKKNIIL